MKRRAQLAITGAVVAGGFALLTILERRRPLRVQREPTLPRLTQNLTLGALSLAAAQLVNVPENRNAGGVLRTITGVILMDYTLWWWHRWNHEVPLLWRFHEVHHIDRDMDASTAFRFHFGEHLLSFFYRVAQVKLTRATPTAVWLWQTLLLASILFHHSNLRLPVGFESRLVRWIVTPRMHGIHHANIAEYERTNFASLLTCWDAIHRTLRLDVPQQEIGAPDYVGETSLRAALLLPFVPTA